MEGYVCAGNADRMAQLSIEAGLFADHGTMSFLFEQALESPQDYATAMYYIREGNETIAVGSCIAVRETGEVNIYVNPGHRGEGIGEKLITMLICTSGMTREFLHADHGRNAELSAKFWRKCRIYLPPDRHLLRTKFKMVLEKPEMSNAEIDAKIALLYVDDLRAQGHQSHRIVDKLVSDCKLTIPGYTDRPEYQALYGES